MNTLIITGGKISADFALTFFENNIYDCVIAADKGLETLNKLCIKPDYIIGDFDSLSEGVLESYPEEIIIKLNPEKDFTDTESAIRLAIDKGATRITILGATGTRLDHAISNIGLLMIPLLSGVEACIQDEHNRIRIIDKSTTLVKNECFSKTVSLIPYTDKVTGVTLRGFYYPLNNRTISRFENISLCVSNEMVEDICNIELDDGIFILIEAKD